MIRASALDPGPSASDAALPGLLRERLLRNGGLLTLSSVGTSVIGLAYWTVATHRYDTAVVGRNSAALSAMMFIAGVANLNLMSALVRFLPVAGSRAGRLVGWVYLVSAATALVLGSAFLLLVPLVAPDLRVLTESTPMAAWFVVSTMAWTVFVLQDSALAGLRKTWLVPVENAVYAGAKLLLVVPLVSVVPRTGIFISWTVALLVSVAPVNYFLFRRAIPEVLTEIELPPPDRKTVIRFAAADFGGALAWLAALNVVPLLVLAMRGPDTNGYFAVVWVIAYTLFLVSANMGVSLVVETASGWAQLSTACRTVVVSTLKMLTPVVAVVVAAAPLILRVFGADYSRHGTTALRLLAISAIPNVITATAVSALRAQRRTGTSTAVLLVLTGLVLALSALLLPGLGIAGVGTAWLVGQTTAAVAVLTVPSLWPRRAPGRTAFHAVGKLAARAQQHRSPASPARARRPVYRPGGPRARQVQEAAGEASRRLDASAAWEISAEPHDWVPVKTQSDLLVAKLMPCGMQPVAVLKMASSPRAERSLRADLRVVAELKADPRLAGWHQLLPDVVESWSTAEALFVVEKYIAGVEGRQLSWCHEVESGPALATAAAAIADLHRRTRRTAVVHADWLGEWVTQPASLIADLYPSVDWRTSALRRVEADLADELLGRPLALGWSHGDYTPGNLILAADAKTLQGVVDWGGASPNAPAFLDALTLLVSTRMLRDHRELGAVVTDLLAGTRLSAGEQELIGIDDRLSLRARLTVCWLNHVSSNLAKAAFYRRRPVWKALNIDAVLGELARC